MNAKTKIYEEQLAIWHHRGLGGMTVEDLVQMEEDDADYEKFAEENNIVSGPHGTTL